MRRPHILFSVLRYGRRRFRDSVKIRRAPVNRTELCPICGERSSKVLTYGPPAFVTGPSASIPEVRNSTKYRCDECGHLYSNWLSNDLEKTAEIYAGIYAPTQPARPTDQPAPAGGRVQEAEALFRHLLKLLDSPTRAKLLDFGCGSNIQATRQLRTEGHDVHCCDILQDYEYDGDLFFRYDHDPGKWLALFDGIISTETLEHLSDTVTTWTYFNRVLRMGGLMAHSFPSQHFLGLDHPDIANPFHVCLFSRRSLKLLVKNTGFALRRIERVAGIDRKVFIFEKVDEIRSE